MNAYVLKQSLTQKVTDEDLNSIDESTSFNTRKQNKKPILTFLAENQHVIGEKE